MADALHHRGPDDSGVWVDPEAGIALGHRRLSIIDLSLQGQQPMRSANGRYVISFNGEVYNHKVLRRELEGEFEATGGHSFRGHSDTEVMLEAISHWGLEPAVKRFVGMFGFALWDRTERALYLVRDRLGIKPLFYGLCGKTLLFGSELKALRRHPAFNAAVDRNALALYLRHSYVPVPHSIYEGVSKLRPGTILRVSRSDAARIPDPMEFWSARDAAEWNREADFPSANEAVDELEDVLKDAVKMRMEADVPLGAFLSGGIDSSTVVALMQAQSTRPVKTFTIGFSERGYNEAVAAKIVAEHLGTEHSELYVTPQQAMEVIPRLPTLYDEPFSDVSQIPTFLVSELARRDVTVSLSGDGGDELFAGYNRYFWGNSIWNKVGWMPRAVRGGLASLLKSVSPPTWDALFGAMGRVLPGKVTKRSPGDKLHKLANVLDVKNRETMYLNLVSHWKDPSSVVRHASEPPTVITDRSSWARLSDFTELMMYLDQVSYLQDDILVKLDRASMGVSLEARVPLLDHRVVEFAWRVPLSMKIRDGQSKWLLRQLLDRYVPRELVERQKMGFGVPIGDWLRGPLRDWAESLLAERRLEEEGFFNPGPIRKKWEEHILGKRSWQHYLWDVLIFEAWLEEWR